MQQEENSMFVVTVKSSPLGDLILGAYASDAVEVAAADRVLKAVEQALARLSKSEGKAAARKDPARKAKRKAYKKLMK